MSITDRIEISQLIEDWALWRDTGQWDRLATVWHSEGRMVTTWCEASGVEFIERTRAAWANGLSALHAQSGTTVDIAGDRALAQTRMRITQRGLVHGVLVDVECDGRFWDALQRENGGWKLRLRQPIYELDRMIPVDPATRPTLDGELLGSFPEGYRHLAYLQTGLGMEVGRSLPGTRGPAVEALFERGRRWLAGDDPACLSSAHTAQHGSTP